MKTIVLSYSPQARAWVAETLVNGHPDWDLIALFGTHILPTAYTYGATGFDVLNGVRALNPDAAVSLADCGTRSLR